MTQTPDNQDLLASSGWPVTYASVLHRVDTPSMVAALVDTNGDQSQIQYEMWHRDDDGAWRTTYSAGAGRSGDGWVQGVTFLYGHTPGAATVQVQLRDTSHDVPVGADGWWIFLADASPEARPPRLLPSGSRGNDDSPG